MASNEPFYKIHVFCCTNVRPKDHPRGSCGRGGSAQLRDYMKAEAKRIGIQDIRINASGCLDRCESGPTMVIYPDGTWYRYQNESDVDEILNSHVINGRTVERLRITQDA